VTSDEIRKGKNYAEICDRAGNSGRRKIVERATARDSQKSCGVLKDLGPQIQWVQSYVTDDKIYCVYIAPNEEMGREHAKQGGFPANRVAEVKGIIDPTTAEE
jgi:uncharacterized protein DUF4242